MEQTLDKWLPYLYWMDCIPNVGAKTNNRLLSVFHSPERIYNIEETELRKFLSEKQLQQFGLAKKIPKQIILERYQKLEEKGIRFIPFLHKDYPNKLRQIADAPFAIYVRGELPLPDIPTIAMIGTRRCSEYGSYVARQFATAFTRMGYQIISGMASGIDGISQRVAIEQGGRTFGILGNGVDVCYPKENADIFQKLPQYGGIISEYAPGTPPVAKQFPPRNRIISALSDVVLVVEAKEKSGTLITVDMALEQGREVYTVPGRITDKLSVGCNLLLRQGAGIALTPESLAEEVFGRKQEVCVSDTILPASKTQNISPLAAQLLDIMKLEAETIDEITVRLLEKYPQKKCSITDIMCELMDLQMKGYISRIGGKYHLSV